MNNMKKLLLAVFFIFLTLPCFADNINSVPLEVTEIDGTPSTYPYRLVFPVGSVSDEVTGATITFNSSGSESTTVSDTTTINLTLTGTDITADGLYTAGDNLTLTGADFDLDTSISLTNVTATNTVTGSVVSATGALQVGSDYITDITGTGLSLVGGVLTSTGSGANTALSNLASVAINTDLIFASNTFDRYIYIADQSLVNTAGDTLYITGGLGNGSGTGGGLQLYGGSGGISGNGGKLTLLGGEAGASGNGGGVSITGGTVQSLGDGGSIEIAATNAVGVGNYNGGNVNISAGTETGSGAPGSINLTPSSNGVVEISGNFTVSGVQWNSGDSIDGTKVSNADLGDITTATGDWAVEDDSHAHTGTTLSAIDISADTNLTAGDNLTLTDDDLNLDANPTLTGATMAGALTLGENGIVLDPAISADGQYSGITEAGTAGATLAFGDLVYLNNDDSRWELVDANLSDGYDKKLGICVLAAAGDGSTTTILLYGKVNAATAFPALTVGAPTYISETAGDIVVAQPTTTDVVIRVIGYANTADELFFCPSSDYIVHT